MVQPTGEYVFRQGLEVHAQKHKTTQAIMPWQPQHAATHPLLGVIVVQGLGGYAAEALLEAQLPCVGLVKSPLSLEQQAFLVDLQRTFGHR